MRVRAFALTALVAAFAFAGCGGPTTTATGDKAGDGKQIFSDAGCGGCHQLSAAGTNGGSGPNLDSIGISAADVAEQVKNGGGGMPAFSGDLTDKQIQAVSEFVAANDGS